MPLTIDGQANSITSSTAGVNIPATVGTLSVGPSGSYMNVTSSGIAATSINATTIASTNITTTQVLNNSGKPILNSTGSILQVTEYHSTSTVTINSTAIKCHEHIITTTSTNSNILVMVNVGRSSNNSDTDVALAVGYRTGSSSSSSSNYTSLHGNTYTRQVVDNLGSFWTQDTSEPGGGTWSGQYNIDCMQFWKLHSPLAASGTSLYYSLWGSSDGTFYLGRSTAGSTDNGYDTSIILMEISA